jgi:phenylalanyl-tRNA synthetase alpha chain
MDMDQLKAELLEAVAGASDAAALEYVRVAALGKQGSVSGLLKTLGKMTPEERQTEGPRIHALREAVTDAISARKARHASGQRPSRQPGHGRAGRNFCRPRFRRRVGS